MKVLATLTVLAALFAALAVAIPVEQQREMHASFTVPVDEDDSWLGSGPGEADTRREEADQDDLERETKERYLRQKAFSPDDMATEDIALGVDKKKVTNRYSTAKKSHNGGRRITRTEVLRWVPVSVKQTPKDGTADDKQLTIVVKVGPTKARLQAAVLRKAYDPPSRVGLQWPGIIAENLKKASTNGRSGKSKDALPFLKKKFTVDGQDIDGLTEWTEWARAELQSIMKAGPLGKIKYSSIVAARHTTGFTIVCDKGEDGLQCQDIEKLNKCPVDICLSEAGWEEQKPKGKAWSPGLAKEPTIKDCCQRVDPKPNCENQGWEKKCAKADPPRVWDSSKASFSDWDPNEVNEFTCCKEKLETCEPFKCDKKCQRKSEEDLSRPSPAFTEEDCCIQDTAHTCKDIKCDKQDPPMKKNSVYDTLEKCAPEEEAFEAADCCDEIKYINCDTPKVIECKEPMTDRDNRDEIKKPEGTGDMTVDECCRPLGSFTCENVDCGDWTELPKSETKDIIRYGDKNPLTKSDCCYTEYTCEHPKQVTCAPKTTWEDRTEPPRADVKLDRPAKLEDCCQEVKWYTCKESSIKCDEKKGLKKKKNFDSIKKRDKELVESDCCDTRDIHTCKKDKIDCEPTPQWVPHDEYDTMSREDKKYTKAECCVKQEKYTCLNIKCKATEGWTDIKGKASKVRWGGKPFTRSDCCDFEGYTCKKSVPQCSPSNDWTKKKNYDDINSEEPLGTNDCCDPRLWYTCKGSKNTKSHDKGVKCTAPRTNKKDYDVIKKDKKLGLDDCCDVPAKTYTCKDTPCEPANWWKPKKDAANKDPRTTKYTREECCDRIPIHKCGDLPVKCDPPQWAGKSDDYDTKEFKRMELPKPGECCKEPKGKKTCAKDYTCEPSDVWEPNPAKASFQAEVLSRDDCCRKKPQPTESPHPHHCCCHSCCTHKPHCNHKHDKPVQAVTQEDESKMIAEEVIKEVESEQSTKPVNTKVVEESKKEGDKEVAKKAEEAADKKATQEVEKKDGAEIAKIVEDIG
eukprot:TRINITY_DN1355_c0_g1_i1.p1 TRINITY_DN1355_c0_g1~~TRINITY_DN1355_c0_g1_i1.p1  ORF type:complete len:1023 (+),score=370.98 TRINITY_DN1355_c0_g1_i1:311-3379(+)